jgi:hypothetical protein
VAAAGSGVGKGNPAPRLLYNKIAEVKVMSRRFKLHAVLAAAGLFGAFSAGATRTEGAISIDVAALKAAGCFNQAACTVEGANVSAVGGTIAKKTLNGGAGFGVNGGPAGGEIDIGEALSIDYGGPRSVLAIKVLFLYNGPEFGDRAETAQIVADGTAFTLAVRGDANNAGADWSGPGTVSKCGGTTATGTGCFVIVDPFPAPVRVLEFKAAPGGAPFGGGSPTSESDYGIGFVDAAPQSTLELQDCSGVTGCTVTSVDGALGFGLNNVQVTNPGGSTEALVIPVRFPDCRYVPQACLDLLPPAGDIAANDDAAREALIGLGVIKPLDPAGPARLSPVAELLNVTPLLPSEVASLYDASGTPPGGLPPMYIGARWRGQSINDFRIDAYFFKTDSGIQFSEVFEGLIDVSVLTGHELGCVADPGNLLAWDVITTVSEVAKSVGGRYADMPVNVGCINPTKVAGSRLSLFSINLEIAPDTWGPTARSYGPEVTTANDAVFARLVQSLWRDVGDAKANYACRQADPAPAGGTPPIARADCRRLASLWTITEFKIGLCVDATFYPASAYRDWICGLARHDADEFADALPASPAGPDPYNRLGEMGARLDVFRHVWDERFLRSLKPQGFCREKGTCAP